MKIVFVKEVQGVGRAGEVKEVSDGYAKNFLIPNNLAVMASPRNIEKVEKSIQKKKEEKVKSKQVKVKIKKKKK